ncbi:MAG: glutamate-5-semialdehyde dehydrogenase [Nitrospirae bacterium]|nr:glutamate-5-semialdehyde dehydrogenase [Nitrospirota bacterium]
MTYNDAELDPILGKTKSASRTYAILTSGKKNEALEKIARQLETMRADILKANSQDYEEALSKGLSPAMCDRLLLTESRFEGMVRGVREVAALADPVGTAVSRWENPDGLVIEKVRVPIGLVGVVYESRPNVTVEVASLCFKSGNGVVLKGGSEAVRSNTLLSRAIWEGLAEANVNPDGVAFLPWTDRKVVQDLVSNTILDVVIPRGGASLMEAVVSHARVPVLRHDQGICHVYVSASAPFTMARDIALNAKVNRPSTCNAMETLLVHEELSDSFVRPLLNILREKEVTVFGCPRTRHLDPSVAPTTPESYATEFLSLSMNLRIVTNLDEALDHIARYGSGHTESIVTSDIFEAERFLREVDASCVMVNASTRLHDGGVFGLGAEVGISTTRIHARGTMGLSELTTTKYLVHGHGHLRSH